MSDVMSVAFLVDRFDVREPVIAGATEGMQPKIVSLNAVHAHEGIVVTHDAHLLVDLFRKKNLTPPTLVDIEEALRLCSQVSKDQGGVKYWNPWRMGAKYLDISSDAKLMEQLLNASLAPPSLDEQERLVVSAAKMIFQLWAETVDAMDVRGERKRFFEREVPVSQIFHYRRWRGLCVDEPCIARFVRESENERYVYFRKICTALGANPIGLSPRVLVEKLTAIGSDLPVERVRTEVIEDWLELANHSSRTAFDVLAYIKSTRDVSVLRRINATQGRVFPLFKVHGTITSRILVSEPGLQQIRRRFREIVKPEPGHELIYLDYAQFEPGIIAALAGDSHLKASYETSDLYNQLALAVYKDTSARDTAKKIFLSYCYGMSKQRIALLLAGAKATSAQVQYFETVVSRFFEQFPKIENLRQQAQGQLLATGQIGTVEGNFRRRLSQDDLSEKEKRWAMNHLVQGTASLIFKDALLRLVQKFGIDSILLPMHDAVLMQYPIDVNRSEFERAASSLMAEAFHAHCWDVKPKVTAASFFE